MYDNVYVRNAIRVVVLSKQQKVSDFVREIIRDKELSYRKVAQNSGGLITHSTVSDVISERVTNLSIDTIIGLAKGLDVTEQEIFDVARGKPADLEKIALERFNALAKGYAVLPERTRKNLEPILAAIETTISNYVSENKLINTSLGKNKTFTTNEGEKFLMIDEAASATGAEDESESK